MDENRLMAFINGFMGASFSIGSAVDRLTRLSILLQRTQLFNQNFIFVRLISHKPRIFWENIGRDCHTVIHLNTIMKRSISSTSTSRFDLSCQHDRETELNDAE
jgi:hypothetical protein